MAPNSNRAFIDNNLLQNLLRDETVVEAFDAIVFPKGNASSLQIGFSPLLLMEVGGQNPRNLKLPDLNLKTKEDDAEAIKQEVYNHYYKELQSRSDLPQIIRNEVERKRPKSTRAHNFFQLLEKAAASSDLHRRLCESVSMDRVFEFTYPVPMRRKVLASFVADIFRGLSSGIQVSPFRGVLKWWEVVYPEMKKQPPKDLASFERLNESLRLKSLRDLVDGEIIHFAVVGAAIKNQAAPVTCFTMDPMKDCLDRLRYYKGFIDLWYPRVVEEATEKDLGFDLVPPCYGTLYSYDKEKNVFAKRDIADIGTLDNPKEDP